MFEFFFVDSCLILYDGVCFLPCGWVNENLDTVICVIYRGFEAASRSNDWSRTKRTEATFSREGER